MKIGFLTILTMFFGTFLFDSAAHGSARGNMTEEDICSYIGFTPKTAQFADCVMEMFDRRSVKDAQNKASQDLEIYPWSSDNIERDADLEICSEFGFKPGTTDFAKCRMEISVAKQDMVIRQQQYALQLEQYNRQLDQYQAQQEALKRERRKAKWSALAKFGAGMANSQSTTFSGAVADGNAAMQGLPPVTRPPEPPVFNSFTVRSASGRIANCTYNSLSKVVSCR